MSGKRTYGMPGGLHAGLDDFRAKQEPRPDPVDDLSRFALARIRDAETEPAIEVMAVYDQPAGPMAHRYAGHVRRDMVAFRRIVAQYCDFAREVQNAADSDWYYRGQFEGITVAMKTIANRWSEHPDYREEWRP